MDIQLDGLQDGDFIETYIHAVAGVTKSADTALIYHATAGVTVTFTCRGTTLNFSCTLNGSNEAEPEIVK